MKKDTRARVLAASRFVAEGLERQPHWLADGLFEAPRAPGETARRVAAATAACREEAELMRSLRATRHFEMTRIAWRDLAGAAPLDETLGDLSDFAEACCEAALAFSGTILRERHGTPCDEQGAEAKPFVLGMGKLGGRELNFSSDIDLIFGYTAKGETNGARALSNEEFFARQVQLLTRYLSERTADGFVFRTDWMLRPFGSAGAPAWSASAMEEYYQTHGREWERYALIKARPVAGDRAAGAALLKALRPFIYRRYLDYNAIGNLRELKRVIEEEVRRKELHDDLKLGDGGIREVEFIVQAHQLVRGWHDPTLRDHRLRPVLRHLGESERLPAETARTLDRAYEFLRRTENAVQMYADEQTHALPEDEVRRAALCAALDIPDWDAFARELKRVRAAVHDEFERMFEDSESVQTRKAPLAALSALWNGRLEAAAAGPLLAELGYREPSPALIESVMALRGTRLVRLMREDTQRRLLQLIEALLREALAQARPEATALRALQIVQAVAGRSTYLTLLRDNDTARTQLLKLVGASPWLTDLLAGSPMLLDALLDAQALVQPPTREEMRKELAALCAPLDPADTEGGMDALRRYQKDTTLRVAAADLLHGLPLVKVSDHLTWLAEAIINQALELAGREMRLQYGRPLRADGTEAGFAIVAYGKFGGLEMSYGSDLDIVFVHDCDQLQEDTVDGPRPLDNAQYFLRLGQRIIHFLSTQTSAGRAYETDLELRPDGRRGMTVSSLDGFASYQRENAWTWEHQALTRARFVAGSARVGEGFAAIRREVLMRQRDAGKLRSEIVEMRQKMRGALDKSRDGKWDVKHGAGGMIDAEFITQYLVLRDAHRDARVIEWSDNWRQLDALEALGTVSAEQERVLIDSYRSYRAWTHARALQNENALADDSLFREERAAVSAIWQAFLG
jgi:[glutamine synthetase] adenylyltransferase / [glutamine synthetase]-adenylyl-L-tyrosine phosphorylase